MRKHLHTIIITFTILLFSCEKEKEMESVNIDYSYFPLNINSWISYSVTFIDIDSAIDKYDTIKYQLKETIESTYTDNEGNTAYRIERFTKENENSGWTLSDIWSASLYTNSAHKVEENIRYVKIIFPVEINKSWNGNAYNVNSNSDEDYYFLTVDESLTINDFAFDSVATIVQNEKESLIDKIYMAEKYVKNIGLVEKVEIDIYSENSDFSLDITERITLGTIYTQEILNYGSN